MKGAGFSLVDLVNIDDTNSVVESNPCGGFNALFEQKLAAARISLDGPAERCIQEGIINDRFDTFALATKFSEAGGTGDIHMIAVDHALELLGIFESMPKLRRDKLRLFLCQVENFYFFQPYHNALHALDVFQAAFMILYKGVREGSKFVSSLEPVEKLSLILAAIGHDMGHTGRGNGIMYKCVPPVCPQIPQPVLERQSIALIHDLVCQPMYNFISDCSEEVRTIFHKNVVDLILSTAFEKTKETVKEINSFEFSSLAGSEERKAGLLAIIQVCDLITAFRPLHVHLELSRRITFEFSIAKNELPAKNWRLISKEQIEFFRDHVTPNLKILTEKVNVSIPEAWEENFKENLSHWNSAYTS